MPVRRTNDVPFPSFSLVMSHYSTSDMRLPSYRTSHLLRFHPYPRVKLSSREMMMTIDDRIRTEYDGVEDNGITRLNPLIFSDLEEEQHTIAGNVHEAIKVPEAGAQPDRPRVRRLSLTILILDFAVLVSRKLSLKK